MTDHFQVLGVGLWSASQRSTADSLQPMASGRPDTQLLAARARGRASLLTLMFANVIEQAARAAAVAVSQLPSVYGSAYGEMATTLALLDMLHGEDGRLSPAKFQASVHNTAGGAISIAQGNRSFSTSIAAGRDTVAMALLEAQAWLLRHPGLIVVACADEGTPPILLPEQSYDALAIALVLANVPVESQGLARLGHLVQTTTQYADAGDHENPCAAGLALVRAVSAAASGSSETVMLNRASRHNWQIEVLPSSQRP